jgi:hypothetical protein
MFQERLSKNLILGTFLIKPSLSLFYPFEIHLLMTKSAVFINPFFVKAGVDIPFTPNQTDSCFS